MATPDTYENCLLRRSDRLPHGDVNGELVALDMDRGVCFGLDHIGTEIWTRLATPMTLDALVASLTQEYDVDAAQCRMDLARFVAQMDEAGLIDVERA